MKKTIVTFLILTFFVCCKKEEDKPHVNENESTQVESQTKKIDSTAITQELDVYTYHCAGEMINDSQADIRVYLPKLQGNPNRYKIKNVYNVTDTNGNKIVLHFTDDLGKNLCPEKDSIFKYTLNFATIIRGNGAFNIDIEEKIDVVVFHENEITVEDLRKEAKAIYNAGLRSNRCKVQDEAYFSKIKGFKDLKTPRTFGLGTIKP